MFISSTYILNVIYSKNYRGPWQTSSAATANYCNFSRGTAIPPSRHYPALNLESSYQQYHQSIKEQVSSSDVDNQYQYPYGSIGELDPAEFFFFLFFSSNFRLYIDCRNNSASKYVLRTTYLASK